MNEPVKQGGNGSGSIDRRMLVKLQELQIEGEPSILDKIITAYLESSTVLISQLHNCLAANDVQALQKSAHSLKSSSANVGAVKLSEMSKLLEQKCRRSQLENIEALITSIEYEFVKVNEGLKKESLIDDLR
jgi:HPt (histidine-containing phosphotransfer) domain-containing protein